MPLNQTVCTKIETLTNDLQVDSASTSGPSISRDDLAGVYSFIALLNAFDEEAEIRREGISVADWEVTSDTAADETNPGRVINAGSFVPDGTV